ncbi:MAG: hypothetical protein PHP57_06350 [Sideroxydans sp.]|nr:hypothetical protein [Sideroxydans sp.]
MSSTTFTPDDFEDFEKGLSDSEIAASRGKKSYKLERDGDRFLIEAGDIKEVRKFRFEQTHSCGAESLDKYTKIDSETDGKVGRLSIEMLEEVAVKRGYFSYELPVQAIENMLGMLGKEANAIFEFLKDKSSAAQIFNSQDNKMTVQTKDRKGQILVKDTHDGLISLHRRGATLAEKEAFFVEQFKKSLVVVPPQKKNVLRGAK